MKSRETLLHIHEELNEEERQKLLLSLGNRPDALHAHLDSTKPHLVFVAYDPDQLCPHDLVAMAEETGVHAHVVDL